MSDRGRSSHAVGRLAAELTRRFAAASKRFTGDSAPLPDVVVAPARDPAHGDFSTAAALAAGKAWKRDPLEIAQAVVEGLGGDSDVAEVSVAKPGFINIRMRSEFWHFVVLDVLDRGSDYGRSSSLESLGPINLEFVSANPTGPVVVVQGRSGSIGSTLAELFRFAGAEVTTETYVNDAGTQLDLLADSLFWRYAALCGVDEPLPADGYPGEYLVDVARELKDRDGDRWLKADAGERRAVLGLYARDRIVEQQRVDLERFRVHFDVWSSERQLHSGKIEAGIEFLLLENAAFESDGAVWLRSTRFGDDKDRVLRRSDGRPTYLAADVAYHRDKFERGARHLIDVLGPDHHGYIKRLEAIAAALGHPGCLEVLIAQQVTLKRGDEQVAMSKRAGNLVTLREIVDEVGVDAARFFFIERAPESQLAFDLELAVERSAKNPVYYVQYGHARIASIIRKAEETGRSNALERARRGDDVRHLNGTAEMALVRRMSDFSRTVVESATARAPHRVAEYARNLATDFHAFYTECPVLGEDDALTSARLSLCLSAQTVLASALRLLGVWAPDKM